MPVPSPTTEKNKSWLARNRLLVFILSLVPFVVMFPFLGVIVERYSDTPGGHLFMAAIGGLLLFIIYNYVMMKGEAPPPNLCCVCGAQETPGSGDTYEGKYVCENCLVRHPAPRLLFECLYCGSRIFVRDAYESYRETLKLKSMKCSHCSAPAEVAIEKIY